MIRPCSCGATPTLKVTQQHGIYIIRLECKCGKHGGTLMFTKPEHRAQVEQAAWDGWNLADR